MLNSLRRLLERVSLIRRTPAGGSLNPNLKFENVQRYLAHLEQTIAEKTQWAVFEANTSQLWSSMRRDIEVYLYREWTSGALVGSKPEQAFFVKCDRTTTTQDDLDNGRLVVMVGVATLRPAEFVLFRIGQWTRDRKDP